MSLFSLLLPALPAVACVGPPPEPVCGKNLTLAIAGPPSTVLTGGGVVDVSALVYLRLLDFPAGLGACPVGPYTVDITVATTCTPGPNGSGQVLGAVVSPGFTSLTVPVTIPSGPARSCVLQALAEISLIDGMTLTESADSLLCIVDPAPGGAKPRLDLELLGPPGTEIAHRHPGDQAAHTYRVTNNDPSESFTGVFSADMLNESRMPTSSGPMPAGTGVFSISDPLEGDNFAIAFDDSLFQGCVILPPDPLDPTVPLISQPIELDPGESADVTVYSRHWGMCADGSCGRSTVAVDGDFSDTSPALACSGFVLAADSGVPPDYGWSDSGQVGEIPEPDDPAKPEIEITGEPSPGVPVEVLIDLLRASLRVDGQDAGAAIVTADRIDPERARIQLQFLGPFIAGADVDFDGEVLAVHLPASTSTVVTEEVLLLDGPSGFESSAPAARLLARITDPGKSPTAFLEGLAQIHVVGIDATGARRSFEWGQILFTRRADGSGFDFDFDDGFESGTGDLLAIEVAMDLRGFLSPEPQGAAIFEDGFESGNVSRWSR